MKKTIRFTMVKILKNHYEINVFTQKTLNLALKINTTFKKSSEFTVLILMKKHEIVAKMANFQTTLNQSKRTQIKF